MPTRDVVIVTAQTDGRAELRAMLGQVGYEVDVMPTASADLEADLVIVDVADGSLWPVTDELAGARMLVIVAQPHELGRAFAAGADDAVLTDARVEEVAARCEAILRRTEVRPETLTDEPAVYADRRLWVNFDSRQVWVGGRPAQLTPREFRLLRELLVHRDKTLSHDELLEQVWDRGTVEGRTPEVLKQYIWRLRQKIEPDPNDPMVIITDPGAGYRLVSQS